jgi:hypothetical protein
MASYAEGTRVPIEKTRLDIKSELRKRGAQQIMFHDDWDRGFTVIAFALNGSAYLNYLPLPTLDSIPARISGNGHYRSEEARRDLAERESARLHRSLFLLIKAKLVAVEDGITTTEQEFFKDLVVWSESGQQTTVYEWYAPQVKHLQSTGLQPPLLPAVAEPKLIAGRVVTK